jgi:hypothetical protein
MPKINKFLNKVSVSRGINATISTGKVAASIIPFASGALTFDAERKQTALIERKWDELQDLLPEAVVLYHTANHIKTRSREVQLANPTNGFTQIRSLFLNNLTKLEKTLTKFVTENETLNEIVNNTIKSLLNPTKVAYFEKNYEIKIDNDYILAGIEGEEKYTLDRLVLIVDLLGRNVANIDKKHKVRSEKELRKIKGYIEMGKNSDYEELINYFMTFHRPYLINIEENNEDYDLLNNLLVKIINNELNITLIMSFFRSYINIYEEKTESLENFYSDADYWVDLLTQCILAVNADIVNMEYLMTTKDKFEPSEFNLTHKRVLQPQSRKEQRQVSLISFD